MTIIDQTYSWAYGPTYRSRTDAIILHHAAGSGSPQDIHRIHRGNGWRGIAYQFYIRRDGSVYKELEK